MAGQALTQVTNQMSQIRSWASSCLSSANGALSSLANVGYAYTVPAWRAVGTLTPYAINLPSLPPSIAVDSPPTIGEIGDVDKPEAPIITFPDKPDLTSLVMPSSPSISVPSMGSVALGSLQTIVLPSVPTVDIGDLYIEPPIPISISPSSWSFPVGNVLISDDPMIQFMIDRLEDNIRLGGTGLSADVEAAIWARDLERNEQQLEDSTDKVVQMWAKKGFSLPDGMLAHSLAEVQKEYMNRLIDRSREIAIKQAELEQSNIFKSLEIAHTLMGKIIDQNIRYEELVLRSLEDTAKYANEYIQLQIAAHNSAVEVYKARVSAHEINIRAQMAKVEIYRAQIQGEVAKTQINEQLVRVYSAQIEAEIAKFKGTLDGNQSLVQIFSAQVQGVLAQAQVNESVIKSYAEELRSTSTYVDIYRSEVEAMKAELEAEKIKIESNVAKINAWAKEADVEIEKYKAAVEVYKAQGSLNVSIADVYNKYAEGLLRVQVSELQASISHADVMSRSITAAMTARVEAAKGVAVAAASMAAGAMAAMSAHASMTYGESVTQSDATVLE